MNLCFLIGKVTQEVEFNFFYNNKKISIDKTKLELSNKSIITINAYDEMADKLYQKTKLGDIIFAEGVLSHGEVMVYNIIKTIFIKN